MPRPFRCLVVGCLWTLMATDGLPKDWQATIQELERKPPHSSKTKLLALAHNNRGIELFQEDAWNRAESHLEKAVELDPRGGFGENLARVYLEHGKALWSRPQRSRDRDEAKRYTQRALQLKPQMWQAHVLLGDMEAKAGRHREATHHWQAALRLKPENVDVQARLKKQTAASSTATKPVKRRQRRSAGLQLQYARRPNAETIRVLRAISKTAEASLRSKLGYTPTRTISVFVLNDSSRTRAADRDHHDIHVHWPKKPAEESIATAGGELFRDYTLLAVDDLSRKRCPNWLRVGLARLQQEQLSRPQRLPYTAPNVGQLWPQLEDAGANADTLEHGYWFTRFLVETHGYAGLRETLQQLRRGQTMEVIVRNLYRTSPTQLEQRWRAWLEETLPHD